MEQVVSEMISEQGPFLTVVAVAFAIFALGGWVLAWVILKRHFKFIESRQDDKNLERVLGALEKNTEVIAGFRVVLEALRR